MGALKGHPRPRKGQKEGCPDPWGSPVCLICVLRMTEQLLSLSRI